LYRVHRHILEMNSEFFRGMFSCGPGDEGEEGKTDDTAVFLPDVTPRELDNLLSALYDGMHEGGRGLDDWKALLSISSRFVFDKIRERAIDAVRTHVPPLDPVERICLAAKHDIPEWLSPAYTELCMRDDPLSDAESDKLGSITAACLARAREQISRTLKRQPMPWRPASTLRWTPARRVSTGCGCKACREKHYSSGPSEEAAIVSDIVRTAMSESRLQV
ncbi:hypothetical protein WOLCODRAFT_83062, partial [Wolfiporia cocos MD-104 SS10]